MSFVYVKDGFSSTVHKFWLFGTERDRKALFVFTDGVVVADEALEFCTEYPEHGSEARLIREYMPWITGDVRFIETIGVEFEGLEISTILYEDAEEYNGIRLPEGKIMGIHLDNGDIFPILTNDGVGLPLSPGGIVHDWLINGSHADCVETVFTDYGSFVLIRYVNCTVLYSVRDLKSKMETHRRLCRNV